MSHAPRPCTVLAVDPPAERRLAAPGRRVAGRDDVDVRVEQQRRPAVPAREPADDAPRLAPLDLDAGEVRLGERRVERDLPACRRPCRSRPSGPPAGAGPRSPRRSPTRWGSGRARRARRRSPRRGRRCTAERGCARALLVVDGAAVAPADADGVTGDRDRRRRAEEDDDVRDLFAVTMRPQAGARGRGRRAPAPPCARVAAARSATSRGVRSVSTRPGCTTVTPDAGRTELVGQVGGERGDGDVADAAGDRARAPGVQAGDVDDPAPPCAVMCGATARAQRR